MNMVMKVLMDHREACEEQGKMERCCEEKSIKLKISSLREAGLVDTQENNEGQQYYG